MKHTYVFKGKSSVRSNIVLLMCKYLRLGTLCAATFHFSIWKNAVSLRYVMKNIGIFLKFSGNEDYSSLLLYQNVANDGFITVGRNVKSETASMNL